MATKTTTKKTTRPVKKAVVSVKKITPLKSKKASTLGTVLSAGINKEQFIKSHKKQLIIGVVVIAIFAIFFFFRGLFVAALVNGAPVSRFELIQELEKQNGKKTLSDIIVRKLIEQEAQKKKITVSAAELDNEIKKIDDNLTSQGQKLDELLAMQGFTKADLLERIRIQKLLEKMVSTDTSINEKEISDYVEQNRMSFPEGTTEEDIKSQAKEALTQQKMDEKIQSFVEDLQKKAKITYFINL
jgi:hypothetical protein